MNEYKIEELIFDDPKIQKAIKEKHNGSFLSYIEWFINDYVLDVWALYSTNIITNPFGQTIRAILIFER